MVVKRCLHISAVIAICIAIKNNNDFQLVYRNSRSFANKYLVMYVKKNDTLNNRIGISVSKKVGNSVVRHRITRLIRESYRLSEDKLKKGLDIVVVARAGAKGKDYKDIESSLLHLSKLHKIWNNNNNNRMIL
jgi:ribonuclease P protein component